MVAPELLFVVFTAPALLTAWWITERPQRGVLLLIALAPFDGLLLLVPHPSIVEAWTEILLVLVVGAAAVRAPEESGSSRARRLPSWAWAALALAAFAVLRSIPDPSAQVALGLRLAFVFALVTAVLWRHPFDEFDRDDLVTILMVTGFIAAVFGIVQQVVGAEALNRAGYEYNEVIRTTNGLLRSFSTFNQPFPFAFHMMTVILIALPVALADLSRRRNRWFLAATPILVIGLSTALVRAAIAGLIVGVVVLAVIRVRVLLHALVALALVGLLVWPAIGSAIVSTSSVEDRTSGWSESVDIVQSNPLGIGVGTVGAAAEKAAESDPADSRFPTSADDDVYQPDNHYMLVLIELGPIGLWLFLALVASAWNHARHLASRADGADEALALGITAALSGAATAAIAATYWEIFPVDLYFWTLLGVLTSIERGSDSTPSPSVPEDLGYRPTSASSSLPSTA